MFKFLHAADIHLDSPLRGLDRYEGCPAEKIRGATRAAFENLVRLAIAEEVAFVLIAGDLYDGHWNDHNTGLWLAIQMNALRDSGIEVFLIRGNHDARNRMTRDLRLPDNVRSLAVDRPETRHVRDGLAAIHGQGFATAAVTDDLAARYPSAEPGRFNVGMLHTSADGREGHASYAPCTVEALRAKGYGYWALGHVHTRETLDSRDAPIEFPGNIQGRHAREPGAKGCLVMTVDGHRVVGSEFRPLDVLRWATCRVDASEAGNADDVAEGFGEALVGLIDRAEGRPLAVRVEVVGESRAHDALASKPEDLDEAVRMAANDIGSGRVWVEKVAVRTTPPRVGGDAPSDGPLGEIDRLLDELRDNGGSLVDFAGKEFAELRKRLPTDLIRGDGEGHPPVIDLESPDSLRGLLDRVRPMLVDRFHASGRPR